MRTRRVATVIALVGIGVVVGYFSAQGNVSAASDGLTAQDYADIQQLYWRYNQGADFRDADLVGLAFTADAVFRPTPELERNGRDEIAAFIGGTAAQGGDAKRRHWNNGWRITPSPEGARGRVYWLVLDVSTEPPTHRSTGYYDDVYVRTSEGWQIKSRTLNFDGDSDRWISRND